MIFPHSKKMFKEAIAAFHHERGKALYGCSPAEEDHEKLAYGFVLTDFKIEDNWDFGDFTIEQSIVYPLGEADRHGQHWTKSFISPVRLPGWVKGPFDHNLFLLGLSAVCSFATERRFLSPPMNIMKSTIELIDLSEFLSANRSRLELLTGRKVSIFDKEEKQEHIGVIKYISPPRKDHGQWTVMVEIDTNTYTSIVFDKDILYNQDTVTSIGRVSSANIHFFNECHGLAFLMPITVRGKNCGAHSVHSDWLYIWYERIVGLLECFTKLDYQSKDGSLDYVSVMQTIRLYQLSHITHQEDFDLSFSLIVAAIESMAQIAISPSHIREYSVFDNLDALSESDESATQFISVYRELKAAFEGGKSPNRALWKRLKRDQSEFVNIYSEYSEIRRDLYVNPKHRYLAARFVRFIFDNYPQGQWEAVDDKSLRASPKERNRIDLLNEIRGLYQVSPTDFSDIEIENIVKDTYRYRSEFLHKGQSSPHMEPTGEGDFFEKVTNMIKFEEIKEKLHKENRNALTSAEAKEIDIFLITHTLMRSIGRNAITSFIFNEVAKDQSV